MNIAPAQLLSGDVLSGRCFYEWWTTEEYHPLIANDYRFIAHRWHVSASSGARSHDDGYLGYAVRAHLSLVVEEATKVLAVWKNFVLERKERTP